VPRSIASWRLDRERRLRPRIEALPPAAGRALTTSGRNWTKVQ
jgi:hypothetical protein